MLMNDSYNPDVLLCLANLSSDEVFTPPSLANQVLDLLPPEIWRDPKATFLDPACKTGVFLREIARRLDEGLEDQIPDRQARINHIMTKQVFGLAITELTALTSRRSLYCSKIANGKYSVCTEFEDEQGNIRFNRTEHTWQNGKCVFCGASEAAYARGEELETHAYAFLHTDNPQELFDMQFDVIISNPPYHMSDGGFGDSAAPLFHRFVEQAKKLMPRYISMIVPARWYSGGKGLDEFRSSMLRDTRLRQLHDFPETKDCFPGINIRGGVCYFLWSADHRGDCMVHNYFAGSVASAVSRPLCEQGSDLFVRYNDGISILRKVRSRTEPTMNQSVSSRKPFGLATNFTDFTLEASPEHSVRLFRNGQDGFIRREQVLSNIDWLDQYKVLVAKASPGGDEYPHLVFSAPIIAPPGSACTETYLVAGLCSNEAEALNLVSYLRTNLVRFLVLLVKNTQDLPRKVYVFVPDIGKSQTWTDEQMYARYGLTEEEIAFVESRVKPLRTHES